MATPVRMLSLGCSLALAVASLHAQGSALPARLSDAEFWRMYSTFSEAGGTFTTENFTSNESAVGEVAAALGARTRSGGAYIGVGAEQNFTYIVALRPDIAFIVDIRRQASIQQLMFKAVFELAATRAAFIELLFALPPPQRTPPGNAFIHDIWLNYLRASPDSARAIANLDAIRSNLTVTHGFAVSPEDLSALAHVYDAFVKTGPAIHYLTGMPTARPTFRSANFASLTMIVDSTGTPRSFLASEGSYAFVRDMHMRNLIVPVVGDFAGSLALRAVADYLKRHTTNVSAFYVSNVEQYLFRPVNRIRDFYENVASLPLDSLSLLIRPGSAGSTPLPSPPFTSASTDAELAAYMRQLRVATPDQRPPFPLCAALPFLDAWRSGRVSAYADAERCAM